MRVVPSQGVTVLHETELSPSPQPSQWLQVGTVRDTSKLATMRAEWNALLESSNAGNLRASG